MRQLSSQTPCQPWLAIAVGVLRANGASGQLWLGGNGFMLYAEVAGDTALAGVVGGYNLEGRAGVRMHF